MKHGQESSKGNDINYLENGDGFEIENNYPKDELADKLKKDLSEDYDPSTINDFNALNEKYKSVTETLLNFLPSNVKVVEEYGAIFLREQND